MLNSLVDADDRIREIAGRKVSASDRLRAVIQLYLDDHFTRKGYFQSAMCCLVSRTRCLRGRNGRR
jgi:hypothetical protein